MLLTVLFFYHSLVDRIDVSTSTMRDYVIAESIHSGIDAQVMKKIVKCESQFRQFDSKGKPLMSPTSDVGVMQINQVHWKRAKSLDLDIFKSAVDNVAMGKIIYREQGFKAWSCYNKNVSDET